MIRLRPPGPARAGQPRPDLLMAKKKFRNGDKAIMTVPELIFYLVRFGAM